MTMVMAPPTMAMMRMSDCDHNLRARYGRQRHEKCKGENSKRELLHTHGMPPLSIPTELVFRKRSASRINPTQVALNWAGCNMAFNRPTDD
jgi:hypothetical protein